MTTQEYIAEYNELKKKRTELVKKFMKSNSFKKLEGKIVNYTLGRQTKKVLFLSVEIDEDPDGKPFSPVFLYQELRKDGKPMKKINMLPLLFYRGEFDSNFKKIKI